MFQPVEFSDIPLHHSVFVPSIELWSRLTMRKEEIMTPDHEIEREATLYRRVREFKPFKEMMSRDYEKWIGIKVILDHN